MGKLGIVIITYNQSRLLPEQVQKILHFCKDDNFEIIVVDNSSKQEHIDAIKWYAEELKLWYLKTESSSFNSSSSHAFAANVSYLKIKDEFDYLFYLDHDCFPVKEFSVREILKKNLFGGIGQGKLKKYFWPGCFMFHNSVINQELIDFSPNSEYKLDTGGNLFKLVDNYPEALVFFDEQHVQNKYFNKSFYNFYSLIYQGTFMHFVNGSNWAKSQENEERINSLLNVLKERTGL